MSLAFIWVTHTHIQYFLSPVPSIYCIWSFPTTKLYSCCFTPVYQCNTFTLSLRLLFLFSRFLLSSFPSYMPLVMTVVPFSLFAILFHICQLSQLMFFSVYSFSVLSQCPACDFHLASLKRFYACIFHVIIVFFSLQEYWLLFVYTVANCIVISCYCYYHSICTSVCLYYVYGWVYFSCTPRVICHICLCLVAFIHYLKL